ncbi:AEC family transporter [Plantibacter flavus]|uniref:AEC family transporter n=1 Tax=Plantibacter TaxID=190323 RepID=UPI0010C19174|nr:MULTISPECIES: AEC family transporter [Plantibacter]MBD8103933.1 AEC family transporter [Plantibacter sp. CFBP 8775]MBD8467381.1 AEC family transporter [Plantibacter sp. CFBP 8798]MBD8534553.1 AEC family transporter [Plantibacter sp. CFBP 13570]TKJ96845.1 AEC family transporter [Plantibacter flavus]
MTGVATAIVPILLLLGGGAAIRRWFVSDPSFWRGLEWMSYRVFTPALFVTSVASTDLGSVPLGPLAVSVAAPILVATGVIVVLRRPLRAGGPQLTSLVQGSIRINTYIGLVFASSLHGAEGTATFALASAVVVPLVNVISVSALSRFGDRLGDSRKPPLWKEMLVNPLIQGVALGLIVNLSGVSLPGPVSSTIMLLAAPALVCGTLISGAALRWSFSRRDILDIGITAIVKLIALPLGAVAIAITFGITGPTLTSILLITAVPTAPSAYVLASRMGGDARLMASITGVQTVLACVTIPLLLSLLNVSS